MQDRLETSSGRRGIGVSYQRLQTSSLHYINYKPVHYITLQASSLHYITSKKIQKRDDLLIDLMDGSLPWLTAVAPPVAAVRQTSTDGIALTPARLVWHFVHGASLLRELACLAGGGPPTLHGPL